MSTPNAPTGGSARTRPAERDWFGDAIKLFDAPPEDDRTQAVAKAAGIWIGYPLCAEVIECLPDATDNEKYKLRGDLNYAHHKATEFLMKEAERAGLNAAPLAEAKRVCQELFKQVRGQRPASNPYGVEWFHHPSCTYNTWPDCLGAWRYALPPAMQEAIRRGEEVFWRLMVCLFITPAVIEQGDGTQPPEGEKSDVQSAKQLLHSWRAIDEALGLSEIYPSLNYDERRRKLAYLNGRFGGPIKTGGRGSQPIANRSELIAWWNSLEDQVEDLKARIRDKQATLQSRHQYGRTALVAPELGGSMKRRRKSSSRTPDKT